MLKESDYRKIAAHRRINFLTKELIKRNKLAKKNKEIKTSLEYRKFVRELRELEDEYPDLRQEDSPVDPPIIEEESEEEEPIEIQLGDSGLIAWISKEDEDLLCLNWQLLSSGGSRSRQHYAVNFWSTGGSRGRDYLHREVWKRMMDCNPPDGYVIDHINGDKLDCRRSNLRLASRTFNEANKPKRASQKTQPNGQPSSRYKGVHKIKGRKKCWRATITYEEKQVNLGTYYTEKEAALAYNDAALEYFGEFAYLNKFED